GPGFAEVALDPADWADPRGPAAGPALGRTLELLGAGRSVVVHPARGPDDPRIGAARALLSARGGGPERDRALGRVLALLVRAAGRAGVRRVAVAGGDTSGYVARQLGIEALSFVAPLAPGAPLCRAHAGPAAPDLDGLEVSFKGGQVGKPDFFERLLLGGAGEPTQGNAEC